MNISDAHSMVTPHEAATAAFVAIDKLQDLPPAHQVAGAALLFLAVCRRYREDERNALVQAERRLLDALTPQVNNKPGDLARALRMYVREEL